MTPTQNTSQPITNRTVGVFLKSDLSAVNRTRARQTASTRSHLLPECRAGDWPIVCERGESGPQVQRTWAPSRRMRRSHYAESVASSEASEPLGNP